VTTSEQDDLEAPASASSQLWQQSVIVVLAAVLLLAVVLVLWWNWPASTEEPIDSIAVVPFVNGSEDEDSAYLSDGIPETISSALARFPQLKVIPTSVLQRYQGQAVVSQTVSSVLGVRAVLTGSVVRRGDALIVRAELMDGYGGSLIWGQRYTRTLNNIFAVEEDIARQVAQALRLQLTGEESERLTEGGTSWLMPLSSIRTMLIG
jgi:TolB-like protein